MLKKHVRQLFQEHGVVTVTPLEAGMTKINELHPYYVSSATALDQTLSFSSLMQLSFRVHRLSNI